jgi:hypothetical protein
VESFLEPLHEPHAGPRPRAEDFQPPGELAALRNRSWLVGGMAAVLCLLGLYTAPGQFYRSYLVGYLLWSGVALGCLALLMLHHMSRGAWGLMVRRIWEAVARTLPVIALLFVPVILGMGQLYEWARPEAVVHSEVLQQKSAWLNRNGFILRAAIYFAIWSGLGLLLSRRSRRQDDAGVAEAATIFRRMQTIAGPGIVIYVLTMTLASVDWLMSLDPHWTSSIYGLYFVISQALGGLAFTVLVVAWLAKREPMASHLQPRHLHDYGKLMLAFVMVWAYFSFSQFLIIWSANMPEETTFYHRRLHGGWQYVSLGIALFHFVLPFLLLLSRDIKRSAKRIAPVALLILLVRWLDWSWQATPTLYPEALHVSWLDFVTPVAIGGIGLGFFFHQLAKRPLIPINDPYMVEALHDE